MGLTNKTRKGVENLPLKRREPLKHRADLAVEDRLDALETRVENMMEEMMELNANFQNFKEESRMRFEAIEQGQARLVEMMGRLDQSHASPSHCPPPPPDVSGSP